MALEVERSVVLQLGGRSAREPEPEPPHTDAMKVPAFCSSSMVTVEVTDTLFEAARKMARHHVGALAVLEEGTLVGVISEADIVMAVAEEADLNRTPIALYMTEDAITIGVTEDAGTAAQRMVEHGIGHLPVMDGDSAVGMVSRGDLLAVGAVATRRGL